MPRVKFRLASGAEKQTVNCAAFYRTAGGMPCCDYLTHPWCLAAGSKGPEACKFRKKKDARADG